MHFQYTESTTALFLIVQFVFIVFSVFPGLSFHVLQPGDVAYVLVLNKRTSIILKGPLLIHVWWPFMQVIIYSTLPDYAEATDVALSTRAPKPATMTIKSIRAVVRIVDPEKVYFHAPQRDGAKAARLQLQSAVALHISAHTADEIIADGIKGIKDGVKTEMSVHLVPMGIEVMEVIVGDFDPDETIVLVGNSLRMAEADAQAKKIASDAENTTVFNEHQAQENLQRGLYLRKQALDTLKETLIGAAEKGLRVLSINLGSDKGNDGLLPGLYDNDEEEKK